MEEKSVIVTAVNQQTGVLTVKTLRGTCEVAPELVRQIPDGRQPYKNMLAKATFVEGRIVSLRSYTGEECQEAWLNLQRVLNDAEWDATENADS